MPDQTVRLPQEGEKLGSGVLLSLISTGGSAYVYKTWVESLELHRAVKVMSPDAEPDVRDRFQTEARINSKLIHPNIVQCFNFGSTSGGLPYLEMEYLSGPSLDTVIQKRGGVPLPAALAIIIGILEGLSYAHTVKYTLYEKQHVGLIHRDLKPSNIILAGEGMVKLMDFGIARPIDFSIHTVAGTMPGTVAYMSPEACAGGDLDFRSDTYQVALTFYELLSGQTAFPQTDLAALLEAKTKGTIGALETFVKNLDPRALAIFRKASALHPDARYTSAQACLADVRALFTALCGQAQPHVVIQSFLEGRPVSGKAFKHSPFKKYRKVIIGAPVAVAIFFALVFVFYRVLPLLQAPPSPAATPVPAVSSAPNASLPAIQAQNNAPAVPVAPISRLSPSSGRGQASSSLKTAPAASSSPAVDRSNPAPTPDDAAFYIDQGKNSYTAGHFKEALTSFQTAIKTPSRQPRQEILKTSVYWSAKCTAALYELGQTPLSNYNAAWHSVLGLYTVGTPEHSEAVTNITEKAK